RRVLFRSSLPPCCCTACAFYPFTIAIPQPAVQLPFLVLRPEARRAVSVPQSEARRAASVMQPAAQRAASMMQPAAQRRLRPAVPQSAVRLAASVLKPAVQRVLLAQGPHPLAGAVQHPLVLGRRQNVV